MTESTWPEFDDVSIGDLQHRKSEKWTRYPAGVLPAAVAEMDFPLGRADPPPTPCRDRRR